VWSGGLGIWGAIAVASVVGAWRVRRAGASVTLFMDAVAPALLVAQAIGRVGNYFNKELFGKPTGLPWGLEIPLAYRPPGYTAYRYFQPSFLYELIFDLLLAALLVWLGHHRNIKPPGLFALYVAGYSAYRIFEETIRIDSSAHFLGLRLNMYIAIALTGAGLAWFARSQRKGRPTAAQLSATAPPGPAPPAAEPAATAADAAEVAETDHAPPQEVTPRGQD
jgi:prolipoprotein diacylglyceryl transferase